MSKNSDFIFAVIIRGNIANNKCKRVVMILECTTNIDV